MQSRGLIPGNRWPRDMVIRVEDRPHALLELLWIREAHDLGLESDDLPPRLLDAPSAATVVATASTRARWRAAWPAIWNDAVDHAGREVDTTLFDRLNRTAAGSPERAQLLRAIVGPNWRASFGEEALDDPAYTDWQTRGDDAHQRSRPRSLADSPERRSLAPLIAAWRAGLTTVVTIPCTGEYARRAGANGLLVTDGTREDNKAYGRALLSSV